MRKRIILSIMLSMLIILISLGIISYLSINDTIKRSLERRLVLANITGKYIEHLIEENLTRLYDISISSKIDFDDDSWDPEKKALKTAYGYSIFTDRIFLLDTHGNVVLSYPHKEDEKINLLSIPFISKTISEGKPVISDIYTIEATQRKVIFAVVPLKNKNGKVIGMAGGEINPTNFNFNQIIKSIPAETNTSIELVDSHGFIIASNNPKRILTCSDHNRFIGNLIANKKDFVGTCHRCHVENDADRNKTEDMLAFVPLSIAPWGISIREPQKIVFSPSIMLRKRFLILSIISIVTAILLGIGMSRGIVKPVDELISATQKIASGDMSKSVAFGGKDEIGMLSSSFEVMRVKLADSLEGLQKYNIELEQRVIERTKQIRSSQKKVETLFKKVISGQEEERKRIARGLHDETMQELSALLMKINMCKAYPEHYTLQTIEEMQNIVLNTLDGIHNIIQNLRPAILDDLGLEAAIRWLLDKQIGERSITYFFNVIGTGEKRLDSRIKIAVFRIIQESVINISRHAGAENVFVILRYMQDSLVVDIEDDGEGFDVMYVLKQTEAGRGLGILGMKERANLIDGRLEVYSMPQGGTRVSLCIPVTQYGDKDV
ncbi:MAG: HAMP domain-containing protein [Nitrospirae bacterium]|nr:HAMP domain-containing protein [Nitrospirota bacterium]